MKERSPHQQKIIRNYYQNQDKIMVQKLGEIVSEIYLAEGARKRDKLWARAEKALRNLKISDREITRLLQQRSPEALAKLVSRAF